MGVFVNVLFDHSLSLRVCESRPSPGFALLPSSKDAFTCSGLRLLNRLVEHFLPLSRLSLSSICTHRLCIFTHLHLPPPIPKQQPQTCLPSEFDAPLLNAGSPPSASSATAPSAKGTSAASIVY